MEQPKSYFGSIELNALGDIIRKHPQLVKIVTGKDGKQRKYIDCYLNERQQPSNSGHTHYMKVAVKKAEQAEGTNYYIGDFKANAPQERPATSEDLQDVPF